MNYKKIFLFLGLTFLVDFSIVAIYDLIGFKWEMPGSVIVSSLFMFMPALVVIFLQKVIYKEELVKTYNISFKINRWFFIAWILPILWSAGALGITILHPSIEFTTDMSGFIARYADKFTPEQLEQMKVQTEALPVHPIILMIFQGLIGAVTINALFAFGEELGWRGFLHKELSHLGYFRMSSIIGIIWGLWHAPIILHGHNYPNSPKMGVLMMVIFCFLMGFSISYITIRAKSVIAACIMHGSLNAFAGLTNVLTKGGNDFEVGMMGYPGFLVMALTIVGLFIYDRNQKDKVMFKT